MGKWSYSHGELTEMHNRVVEETKSLENEVLTREHDLIGNPELHDMGLQLYYGSSGDGWACIDNSSDQTPDKVPFMMHVPRGDLNNPARLDRWRQRATIAAHRLGVKRRPFVVKGDHVDMPAPEASEFRTTGFLATEVGTAFPHAVHLCNDTGLPAAALPMTTMEYAHAVNTRPMVQPPRVLVHNDVLRVLNSCGITCHSKRGEFIIMANAQELEKFALALRELK